MRLTNACASSTVRPPRIGFTSHGIAAQHSEREHGRPTGIGDAVGPALARRQQVDVHRQRRCVLDVTSCTFSDETFRHLRSHGTLRQACAPETGIPHHPVCDTIPSNTYWLMLAAPTVGEQREQARQSAVEGTTLLERTERKRSRRPGEDFRSGTLTNTRDERSEVDREDGSGEHELQREGDESRTGQVQGPVHGGGGHHQCEQEQARDVQETQAGSSRAPASRGRPEDQRRECPRERARAA